MTSDNDHIQLLQTELEETNQGVLALHTELEKARAKVAKASRRWTVIFETMTDAVFLLSKEGIVLQHNSAARELLAPGVEDAVDKHWREVLDPQVELEAEEVDSWSTHRELRRKEIRAGDLWYLVSHSIVADQQEEEDRVLVFSDITERQQLFELTQRKNRYKSEFLANVSHEIRNPITGLLGYVQLLNRTILDSQQQEWLESLADCGESLLRLVNDLIDISRIEMGAIAFCNRNFSLSKACRQVLSVMQAKAREKKLELSLSIASEVEDRLNGDADRLKQILTNLVGNAVKFTREGSVQVNVELKSETEERQRLRFEVRDTGPGITAELSARLFQRFSQPDWSFEDRHKGAGLGLSICRELVERQNGEIGVESEFGQGSVFWFILEYPLATGEVEELAPLESPANSSEVRGTVLLAEDNPMVRKVTSIQMENLGYTVHAVEDGAKAWELLHNEHQVDLVVCDCQLPKMSGLELTRKLRAEGSDLPIIAVTGRTDEESRASCLEAGMNDYFHKPLSQEKLYRALRHWIK